MGPKYSRRHALIACAFSPRHCPTCGGIENERDVIEMNAGCFRVSGWVQRASSIITTMIDGTGHLSRGLRRSRQEETTMFKTISAALLAVSVLAAPAFAATAKTAPVIKATPVKASVLNANAKMGKHHHKYARHHHHRKYVAKHSHAKVGFKHASPTTTKRG
jgi:hypothetical protein